MRSSSASTTSRSTSTGRSARASRSSSCTAAGRTTATWSRLVPHLTRSFRVIGYDRRGHSRSPRGAAVPTRRRHEDDLAALIEALDCAPAILVGTSYGALIALALAGRRPDLVRGVVAHEPPALALQPLPEVEALFAGVRDQIVAGDAAAATQRFFEEAVLGTGGWDLVPEPVQRAAVANAQTFVDMLADPQWGALDVTADRTVRRTRPHHPRRRRPATGSRSSRSVRPTGRMPHGGDRRRRAHPAPHASRGTRRARRGAPGVARPAGRPPCYE